MTTSNLNFLATLEEIVVSRQSSPVEGSYTSELFAAGTTRIAQKVGEEAVELALASCQDSRDETLGEAADLIYHFLVLLADQQISIADVVAVLESRHAG